MPRGKTKKTPEQENQQESQTPQEMTPPAEPAQETGSMEQAETPEEQAPAEQNQENPSAAGPESGEHDQPEENAANSQEREIPGMSVAQYIEYFQLDIHPQEMVDDFIAKLTHTEMAPQQQAPIPLDVKITSLEMDGSTLAFARARYGDLSIDRIRVKQDEYGALSVAMPKFRHPDGWRKTCKFGTMEAENRMTEAVLGAYEQQLAQMQGQGQMESDTPEQEQAEPEENQDFDDQEQDGSGMGMSMSQ